jgi:SAM-dependent methyltransferase
VRSAHAAWQPEKNDASVPHKGACPSCGLTATRSFYRAPDIPVHSCVLLDSPAEARAFPRRSLQLAFCPACGFVFNEIFDEDVMHYSTGFEESQHFSETFNGFAKSLASEIAIKCSVAGKRILEIGCGKGEFLQELCRLGEATGLGIDPAYRADKGRGTDDKRVRFIVDIFRPDQDYGADVILCRHTLEHIAPVSDFIRSIREFVGSRNDIWVVFETPDVKRVLSEGAFWDIYYEHCSYFSPGTHARLFRQEGFDVTDLALLYDNQYIVQYAKLAAKHPSPPLSLEDDLAEMNKLAENFPSLVAKVQDEWRERVRKAYAAGRRVVLWGGGSKGVSFLTTLGLDQEIAAVVDVNPYKQGKFMPGTGHPVIAPKILAEAPPDLVIVMNRIYVDEIAASLKRMDLTPEIVAVGAGPSNTAP